MRWSISLFFLLFLLPACGDSGPLPVHTAVGLSSPLPIDRIYKSMAGPTARIRKLRLQRGPQELLWLTAYRTKVVNEDGGPISQEFMCHNNLDLQWEEHASLFGWTKRKRHGRTFTASQGQFGIELPEGFGIPVLSNEPLEIVTQVLNHNIPDPDLEVRHEITIEYVRDSDARGRLKPLYPSNAYVMALVEGDSGVFSVEHPDEHQEGASCLPGDPAPQVSSMQSDALVQDFPGRVFTGHWIIPPGPEVRHTLVTRMLDLPFDTTVHYIATHLHPFAETLELRDLTTGETLFTAEAEGVDEGVGLSAVTPFSSAEGIPVYKDHDYEMVSTYDNTSGVDQDAMATFFFFLHDKEAEAGLEAIRDTLAAGGSVGDLGAVAGSGLMRASREILDRERAADEAEVLQVLIGWKRREEAYGGKMDERAKQRTRAEADELVGSLLDRAREGEDFRSLMAEYSEDWASAEQGSSYQVTPTAQFVPQFKDIALRLQPEEIGAVRTVYGWHIVKRIE